MAAAKTTSPPKIDGDLSDPAWKDAPAAKVFWDRQHGGAAADQTTAYLLYDDQNIYVAFRCKDSQPDQIVARETVTDSKYQGGGGGFGGDSEDNVEVVFDPFLSHRFEDFARFSVNAIGTRSARITGGRAVKNEWRGDWEAAAKRAQDGWTAEMRIPWSILNFPSGGRSVTMGINFFRWQDRTKIQSCWSNVGPQYFTDLEGLWTGVLPPAGAFQSKLSLLPYTLSGVDQTRPTNRTGLDVRYTITPQLTAVGSINPDFATIEGAVEGIAFSRSERFVPERRPFFLEGRDYFSAGEFYAFGPYFYSNHIDLFDAGTKIYGKVTPTDSLGVLHTIDFGNRNDLVTRYRHDFSPTSSGSFFFTQKSAKDDNNSVGVVSQDARWGKFGVYSEWAMSTGQAAGGGAQDVNLTYQDKRTFTSLQLMNISPLFRDANGLIFFNDFRGFSLYQTWGAEWRKGPFRGFDFEVFPQYTWHTDGRPFQRGGGVSLNYVTRSDWLIGVNVFHNRFDEQTDSTVGLFLRSGVSNRFRQWGINVTTGTQGDRPSTFIGPSFSYRMLRKLDVIYGGGVQNLDGVTQQHVLTMNYELSPTRSFGGRVVVQNADTNWYVSYRNAGHNGTDMFFIIGDPNATRFVNKVAVKFVFAM